MFIYQGSQVKIMKITLSINPLLNKWAELQKTPQRKAVTRNHPILAMSLEQKLGSKVEKIVLGDYMDRDSLSLCRLALNICLGNSRYQKHSAVSHQLTLLK